MIISIVKNLKYTVSIDHQTPRDKRDIVPTIIRSAVNADPDLSITACRLSSLSEYSIDFTFESIQLTAMQENFSTLLPQ